MIFLNAVLALSCLVLGKGNVGYEDDKFLFFLGSLFLINSAFMIVLLYNKKWGFWGFCISTGLTWMLSNQKAGSMFILGLVCTSILRLILQIKKDGISCWDNLS